MREAIARLGGELSVVVGARWTHFTATVPGQAWRKALTEIVASLRHRSLTQPSFAELQDRLVRRHLAQWRTSPLLSRAAQWLHYGDLRRQDIIDGIEDRNLPEMILLQRRHYRPSWVGVGIWLPGGPKDPARLARQTQTALLGWTGEIQPATVGPGESRPPSYFLDALWRTAMLQSTRFDFAAGTAASPCEIELHYEPGTQTFTTSLRRTGKSPVALAAVRGEATGRGMDLLAWHTRAAP